MQIETKNLQVGYSSNLVLKGVDVTIPANQITALIGPNGCGKSTLLKTLARVLLPESGRVLLSGKELNKFKANELARILALLPQSHIPPESITVREVVALGRSPYTGFWGQLSNQDWETVDKAMRLTGVDSLAEHQIAALSGGQCQRVWLALTLAQDSAYVLLDEPTTYLDLNHQVELMKLIQQLREQGKTIITVLHDINQACRYCDHLIVMKEGSVVISGSPEQVLNKSMLTEVFDLQAEIYRDPLANTPMCIVY